LKLPTSSFRPGVAPKEAQSGHGLVKRRPTTSRKKFSDGQKAFILNQGKEGIQRTFAARPGSAERRSTMACYRTKYAAYSRLDDKNAKLKMLAADLSLDKQRLQDLDLAESPKRPSVHEPCGRACKQDEQPHPAFGG
jgi:putative transposase